MSGKPFGIFRMDHGLWLWGHLPVRNRFGKAGGKHRSLAAAILSFSPLSGVELKPRALRVVVY
jgi:hypothetical protein